MFNKTLAVVAFTLSNVAYASCRFGECEDYHNGQSGNEVFFAMGVFAIAGWLVFSESSPAANYFYDKIGMAWLVMFLAPVLGAILSLIF